MRAHLFSQVLSLFSHASSYFVIVMSRLVSKLESPVIKFLPEAVVNRADYWKLFVAIALGILMAVTQRITLSARVSCSVVLQMLLMRRLLVIFKVCFQAVVLFFLQRL